MDLRPGEHAGRYTLVEPLGEGAQGSVWKIIDLRLDLHARFSVRLALPRLSDRPEDLFAILEALYRRVHDTQTLPSVRVEVIELLMLHSFPANVRDLDRLVQAVDPRVGLKLPLARRVLEIEGPGKAPPLTRESVAAALAKHGGNQVRAARELGVSRARLRRVMAKDKLAGSEVR